MEGLIHFRIDLEASETLVLIYSTRIDVFRVVEEGCDVVEGDRDVIVNTSDARDCPAPPHYTSVVLVPYATSTVLSIIKVDART